ALTARRGEKQEPGFGHPVRWLVAQNQRDLDRAVINPAQAYLVAKRPTQKGAGVIGQSGDGCPAVGTDAEMCRDKAGRACCLRQIQSRLVVVENGPLFPVLEIAVEMAVQFVRVITLVAIAKDGAIRPAECLPR